MLVADRTHSCWDPDDSAWHETLRPFQHFGIVETSLRCATSLVPLCTVFTEHRSMSLEACLKLGLRKSGAWVQAPASTEIFAVTDEAWLPGQSASSAAASSEPNFAQRRQQLDQEEMQPLLDAQDQWSDPALQDAPMTPRMDEEPEESERLAKRQRRMENLSTIPEEELPPMTEGIEEIPQTDVERENLMEGQWKDWIRRSMTTGTETQWPDEIAGMPARVRDVLKSVPDAVKAECKLVHHQLGHPSRATMLRMAKLANKGALHI
eukprot:6454858-Amphidinium_carterae.1